MSTGTEHQQHAEEDMQTTLEKARTDAKQQFEQERDAILQCLPSEYKAMFGEVVFSKWKKSWLPCLVLSPYMVPPGPIRDQWMGMFNKVRTRPHDMCTSRTSHPCTYLVALCHQPHKPNHLLSLLVCGRC